MHQQRRRKVSDFALQLREKQKMRRIYGVLERQMKNSFRGCGRGEGATGEGPAPELERRLDNTIYRAGFGEVALAGTSARRPRPHHRERPDDQDPSFEINAGDSVAVKESSRGSTYFKEAVAWAKPRRAPAGSRPTPRHSRRAFSRCRPATRSKRSSTPAHR